MPIDRDRFEHLTGDALSLRKGTNAYAVVSFLAEHPEERSSAPRAAMARTSSTGARGQCSVR